MTLCSPPHVMPKTVLPPPPIMSCPRWTLLLCYKALFLPGHHLIFGLGVLFLLVLKTAMNCSVMGWHGDGRCLTLVCLLKLGLLSLMQQQQINRSKASSLLKRPERSANSNVLWWAVMTPYQISRRKVWLSAGSPVHSSMRRRGCHVGCNWLLRRMLQKYTHS